MTNGQSGGTGTDGTAPPLITGSGLNGNAQYTPLAPLADEQARRHLENLNVEIVDINLQIAEGLAFQLPEITPLTVNTQPAKKLHVPEVTETSGSGGDGRWTGGSGSEGSYGTGGSGHTGGSGTGGTGSGSNGDGSNGTGSNGTGSNGTGSDGTGGTGDGTTKPQDPGGQQDDPSNGGDPTTQQPGTGDQQQQQPGQDQQQQQQQPGQDEAPAVIGGPGNQRTELAQTPTATQPPPTTTTPNPYTATPNPYVSTPPTIFPNTQPPGGTPYGGTGAGPWYGGSGAPATSPSVLRSTPGAGNGFMAFPPGAMGAAGQNNGEERTREYYDSETDLWASPVQTSPDKLG